MKKQLNSKKIEPVFTGGDHLTGYEGVIHHLMMCNELANGKRAYKLSFAGGNSGLSFGGNQMDMSRDPDHIKVFIDILTKATDQKGEKFLQNNVLSVIKKDQKLLLKDTGKTPSTVFGENLKFINAALSSEYGINAINAAYPKAIRNGLTHVEKMVDLMKNPAAKTFYSSDFGKAFLFEYHNQYGLAPLGKLMFNYVDGIYNKTHKIIFTTKKPITAPTGKYTFKDHQNYIHSTEQWAKKSKVTDDRLKHSLIILSEYGLCETGPFNLSVADKYVKKQKLECPIGSHFVRECIVHYSPSEAHPEGLVGLRVAHCAHNPGKKRKSKSLKAK